jgi:hypothetical protein
MGFVADLPLVINESVEHQSVAAEGTLPRCSN